jgi:small-conductance mechanosensitive channel
VSTDSQIEASASPDAAENTEQRIAWLTPVLGLVASAGAYAGGCHDWAAGLLVGTALAWLNFRWLRRGLDALVVASVEQQDREKPRVPLSTYFTTAFRYGLLAIAAYVIFLYLHIPIVSMIIGLLALGAATIAASVWEVLASGTTRAKKSKASRLENGRTHTLDN